MGVETRAQLTAGEAKLKAVSEEDPVGSRLTKMEEMIEEQNQEIDRKFSEMLEAIRSNRFEKVLDDPVAELKQLKETNSIVEYHKKFELLSTRVNLTEDYLVRIYLDGLQIDTQVNVQMFQPQTIHQCFLIGKLYERAHPLKRDKELEAEEKLKLENHENLVQEAILEEESIPQFQVPIANSEILRSSELREPNLGFENLDDVVMNENLEQEWIQKNIHKIFEVDGDVEKSQNVVSNTKLCSAHQMFGKMSQQKERLGIKKKMKVFKSWMFKYRRGFKKLHTLIFSTSMRMVVSQQMDMVETTSDLLLLNGNDNPPRTALGSELEAGKIDSWGQERSELCTENKEEVKGCLEQGNVVVDFVKVKEMKMETQIVDRGISLSLAVLETGTEEIIGSHAMMAFVFKQTSISYSQCMEHNLFDTMLLKLQSKKKQRKCHKSWMFKYKLMTKKKFSKTWFMFKGDCFKEDDQVYHETLPIWLPTRFKFWKFIFVNMNLEKTRPQIEDVMGEDHKRQHGDNASDAKVIETLKDLQQFPLGEVMFQIKHKWRVKFLLLVSELQFSFESVACVALLDEQFSMEKSLIKATGTCGEDMQQLARVFSEQLLQTSLVIQVVMRNKKIKFPKRWMFKYKASLKNIQVWSCGLSIGFTKIFSSSPSLPCFSAQSVGGNVHTSTHLPSVLQDAFVRVPERIIERKMVNRQGQAATKVLVKWKAEPVEEATWEFLFDLKLKFPHFDA